MSEQRFIDLESRLAHQDHMLSELNDVVTGQAARLQQLEALCAALVDRLRTLGDVVAPAGDERPPHY